MTNTADLRRLLAEQIWTNNQGGDGGDSVLDLRLHREADALVSEDRWDRTESVTLIALDS
jgi:hypothetical protein